MKLGLIIASASVAVLATAMSTSAGLLLNPSFEAGVDSSPDAAEDDVAMSTAGPWGGWNNWVPPFSGFYTASVARTGAQAGKTFSGPNAGIYQYAPVTAGEDYIATAWFLNNSADAMNGVQTADIRIIFFSGAGGTGDNLGTFVAPTAVSAGTSQDIWTPLSATATAPVEAQSAQVMAFFNNPEQGGGAMYVDDMDFNVVPEPTSLALGGLIGLMSLRRRRAER